MGGGGATPHTTCGGPCHYSADGLWSDALPPFCWGQRLPRTPPRHSPPPPPPLSLRLSSSSLSLYFAALLWLSCSLCRISSPRPLRCTAGLGVALVRLPPGSGPVAPCPRSLSFPRPGHRRAQRQRAEHCAPANGLNPRPPLFPLLRGSRRGCSCISAPSAPPPPPTRPRAAADCCSASHTARPSWVHGAPAADRTRSRDAWPQMWPQAPLPLPPDPPLACGRETRRQ